MPVRIKPAQSKEEHQRHRRKYAEGDLGEDNSFYFRGPEGKLKLRAQNLTLFAQIAQGVDDETWLFHLRKGDYSRWFREVIKDPDLAAEAEKVEKDEKLSASESRARIIEVIMHQLWVPSHTVRHAKYAKSVRKPKGRYELLEAYEQYTTSSFAGN